MEDLKETIKAEEGYRVKKIENLAQESRDKIALHITDFTDVVLLDGAYFIMAAQLKSYEDYIDECENGNNEYAEFCECFVTKKGNKFIYWRDEETDEDFLTKVIA